jgi:plastocyanin
VRLRVAMSMLALLAGGGLVFSGCGTGSDLGSAATTQSSTTAVVAGSGGAVHVVMKSLEFSPAAVDARVGQRIAWLNEDSSPHNVTYVSGPRFKSSRTLGPQGGRFSLLVTQPGTIHYYCTLHPWMKATIVVSR